MAAHHRGAPGSTSACPEEIKDTALAYLVVVLEDRRERPARRGRRASWPSCSASSARSTSTCCPPAAATPAHRGPREGVLGGQGQRRRRHRRHRSCPGRRSPSSWPRWPSWRQAHDVAGSPAAATPATATSTCRCSRPTPRSAAELLRDALRGRHGARRRHLGRARHRHREAAVLPRARGPGEARPMRRIKAAFDPDGILNPGTICSTPTTGGHPMNGAQALIRTLVDSGVDVVLHEPRHLGDALRRRARRRARDARRARPVRGRGHRRGRRLRPHGRRPGRHAAAPRARASATASPTCTTPAGRHTPIVNIVGDHATYHKQFDAPLESDIETVGRQRVGLDPHVGREPRTWPATRPTPSPRPVGPPGQVATLILPADVSLVRRPAGPAAPVDPPRRGRRRRRAVDEAGQGRCARGEPAALLLGGRGAREQRPASPPAAWPRATGAKLLGETFPARLERGAGLPAVERLGYLAEFAADAARRARATWCSSTPSPRCRSSPTPDKAERPRARRLRGPRPRRRVRRRGRRPRRRWPTRSGAGRRRPARSRRPARPSRPARSTRPRSSPCVGALLPEGAIVSDEANTAGLFAPGATAGAPHHDWLTPHRRRHRHGHARWPPAPRSPAPTARC